MRSLRLTVAYDGTGYVGWQLQLNGISVQQRMEEAWQRVTGEQVRFTASGRTDAGVHALGQVCSVATMSGLECETLLRALNANLPPDIAVTEVASAPEGFHAIRDAIHKTYRYSVVAGPVRPVFGRQTAWHVPVPLDVDAMRLAAAALVGEHDFAAFQAAGSERQSTVRRITRLEVKPRDGDAGQGVELEVSADGFLYNMVRIIAGSLVLVGRGNHPPAWVKAGLESRDRSRTGPTAPAHGLCLLAVCYAGSCRRPDLPDRPGTCRGQTPDRAARLSAIASFAELTDPD
jgi:tRNA pseudouridine38-40 synthase